MLTAIRFCAEAERGSDIKHDYFPYKKFEEDFNNHIEYYLEYLLPFEFAKDRSAIGMEKAIENIVNEYTEASDAKSKLFQTFSNYRWTVIYYPDHVAGWDMHAFYCNESIKEDYYASGSIMFMRKLKKSKKNALIAWELDSPYITPRYHGDIDLTYPSGVWKHARTTRDYIHSRNNNLNFLLTFREYSFSASGFYKYETRYSPESTYVLALGSVLEVYVRSFANRYAIVNQVKKPTISNLYSLF
jgi:hypothetical protein